MRPTHGQASHRVHQRSVASPADGYTSGDGYGEDGDPEEARATSKLDQETES
ncbi:hypothetical protein F443_18429, partial [Phytophthora nicotianae P1569]